MFLPSKRYSINILTQVLMIHNIMETRFAFARHFLRIKDDSCTTLSVRVCWRSSVATDGFVSHFCERLSILYFSLAQWWITSKPGESKTTKTTKLWSGKEFVWACAVCGQVQLSVCLSLLIKVPVVLFLAWGTVGVSVCHSLWSLSLKSYYK